MGRVQATTYKGWTSDPMRSSKSRSRSKSNRSRSVGNIVNRVFESSGPEGKVRGTPQQIIEKYTQLARVAHLSNDRVAAENFQQHAEHYTRMLGEAQREMDVRREQQEQQQQRERPQGEQGRFDDSDQPDDDVAPVVEPAPRDDEPAARDEGTSDLVETPEGAAEKPRRRGRGRPRAAATEPSDAPADAPAGSGEARAAE